MERGRDHNRGLLPDAILSYAGYLSLERGSGGVVGRTHRNAWSLEQVLFTSDGTL